MKIFHFQVEFLGLHMFSVLTKHEGSLLSHELSHCSHLVMACERTLMAPSALWNGVQDTAMLHYSLFIHEMGACSFSPREERCLWAPPVPFRNALFDLRGMPLASPSCPERKVRRIRGRPDKTGMHFLLACLSFWLGDCSYIFISFPFFCLSGRRSQIQGSTGLLSSWNSWLDLGHKRSCQK